LGQSHFLYFIKVHLNDYFLKTLDGLVITGGNFDINPALYSETTDGSRNIKNQRTNFEIDIFKKFLQTSKPILGICGGEQLMNVATGGDLIQDIRTSIKTSIEHEQTNPRNEVSHEVI
jgi:putative glutamine amidotransferase